VARQVRVVNPNATPEKVEEAVASGGDDIFTDKLQEAKRPQKKARRKMYCLADIVLWDVPASDITPACHAVQKS
jgi:hypothetical protein